MEKIQPKSCSQRHWLDERQKDMSMLWCPKPKIKEKNYSKKRYNICLGQKNTLMAESCPVDTSFLLDPFAHLSEMILFSWLPKTETFSLFCQPSNLDKSKSLIVFIPPTASMLSLASMAQIYLLNWYFCSQQTLKLFLVSKTEIDPFNVPTYKYCPSLDTAIWEAFCT